MVVEVGAADDVPPVETMPVVGLVVDWAGWR